MFSDKREVHLQRLRDNHVCFVAEKEGELIAYEWVYVGTSHYEEALGYRFRFPQQSVWLYDGLVNRHYRGMGVSEAVLKHTVSLYAGDYSFCCIVRITNYAMLSVLLRFGFRIARQFIGISLFGLRVSFEKRPSRSTLAKLRRTLRMPTSVNIAESATPFVERQAKSVASHGKTIIGSLAERITVESAKAEILIGPDSPWIEPPTNGASQNVTWNE